MRTTRTFRLFKARDEQPSPPPFHAHYRDLRDKVDKGEMTGHDPYPDDLQKLAAECIADEEARIGRKLTPAERERIFDDEPDYD